MYLCILAGALWGVPVALPIVCISIATGASFCYMLSKHVGDCIRVMPRWQQRVDTWKATVQQYEGNLLSYLTILRMMPVPPHFVVNIIAPHLGVPLSTFWLSTLCGVFCTSLIYTAIGKEIGQITSSDSFHIFTWQNMLLMTVVAMAFIFTNAGQGSCASTRAKSCASGEHSSHRRCEGAYLEWSNGPALSIVLGLNSPCFTCTPGLSPKGF